MIFFQWISLPLIVLLIFRSGARLYRGDRPRWMPVAGVIVWLLAGVAIAMPDSTTTIARTLGIGRGADLITYSLAIAFVVTTFYFYHRYRQLTVDLTTLTRHLALLSAQSPDEREIGQGTSPNPPESAARLGVATPERPPSESPDRES